MIKVNEIRIGNLVATPHQSIFRIDLLEYFGNDIGKVSYVLDGTPFPCHPLTWYLEDLQPIPLTEEWLLKAGFKKKTSEYYTLFLSDGAKEGYSQRIAYWISDSKSELCFAGVCFKRVNTPYIHQLQNLYFALTGEELNFKL